MTAAQSTAVQFITSSLNTTVPFGEATVPLCLRSISGPGSGDVGSRWSLPSAEIGEASSFHLEDANNSAVAYMKPGSCSRARRSSRDVVEMQAEPPPGVEAGALLVENSSKTLSPPRNYFPAASSLSNSTLGDQDYAPTA